MKVKKNGEKTQIGISQGTGSFKGPTLTSSAYRQPSAGARGRNMWEATVSRSGYTG
jgi:hypothetical protein